jgi:hypothetical protein
VGTAGVGERPQHEGTEAAADPDADAHGARGAVLRARRGLEDEPDAERVLAADPQPDDQEAGERGCRRRDRPGDGPADQRQQEAPRQQQPRLVQQREPADECARHGHAREHGRHAGRRGRQGQPGALRE